MCKCLFIARWAKVGRGCAPSLASQYRQHRGLMKTSNHQFIISVTNINNSNSTNININMNFNTLIIISLTNINISTTSPLHHYAAHTNMTSGILTISIIDVNLSTCSKHCLLK